MTEDIPSGELPELPAPTHYEHQEPRERYTADQMHDYARKAIAAQTAQAVPNGWRQAIEKIMQSIGAGDQSRRSVQCFPMTYRK